MLYRPERYAPADAHLVNKIIDEFPFATLLTQAEGDIHVSHLPLLRNVREGKNFLLGHLALANAHSKVLSSSPVLCLFNGPHGYISPTWYGRPDVPTWNYMVVHVTGNVKMISDAEGIDESLRLLSQKMESGDGAWQYSVPPDLARPGVLTRSIAAFEIEVQEATGKFKISQNKPPEVRDRVLTGLDARARSSEELNESELLAKWMREFYQSPTHNSERSGTNN